MRALYLQDKITQQYFRLQDQKLEHIHQSPPTPLKGVNGYPKIAALAEYLSVDETYLEYLFLEHEPVQLNQWRLEVYELPALKTAVERPQSMICKDHVLGEVFVVNGLLEASKITSVIPPSIVLQSLNTHTVIGGYEFRWVEDHIHWLKVSRRQALSSRDQYIQTYRRTRWRYGGSHTGEQHVTYR